MFSQPCFQGPLSYLVRLAPKVELCIPYFLKPTTAAVYFFICLFDCFETDSCYVFLASLEPSVDQPSLKFPEICLSVPPEY